MTIFWGKYALDRILRNFFKSAHEEAFTDTSHRYSYNVTKLLNVTERSHKSGILYVKGNRAGELSLIAIIATALKGLLSR